MAYKQNNNPFKLKTAAAPKKVSVFGGKGTVDVSTEAGRKILEEIKSIKTVSSSEKKRVASKLKNLVKGGSKVLKLGSKASVVLAMLDGFSAGKGSTTLDKDKYDLMKNTK
tara:strand:+ start:267 stop:599 length:333 start_codon:yes stop_codon:yes gene_type:complete